jgi:methylated-DNA-[protein]-cysteine S-methyltransferase
MYDRKNRIEFPPWPDEFQDRLEMRGRPKDQATHHYLVVETAARFCGIAWNSVGITRFQLPTRSPEATKRILLRRAPGAPTPEVAEVIAVKRYFEGEETDFSGVRLDLDGQDLFFERI